jgi:hypothetical protein
MGLKKREEQKTKGRGGNEEEGKGTKNRRQRRKNDRKRHVENWKWVKWLGKMVHIIEGRGKTEGEWGKEERKMKRSGGGGGWGEKGVGGAWGRGYGSKMSCFSRGKGGLLARWKTQAVSSVCLAL